MNDLLPQTGCQCSLLTAYRVHGTILLWFQLITAVLLASSLALVANGPPVPDAFTMATGGKYGKFVDPQTYL